jgi:hypothetical protein
MRIDVNVELANVAVRDVRIPARKHMVERFAQIGSSLFAVLSNGELLFAPLATLEWQRIVPELDDINAVTGMVE